MVPTRWPRCSRLVPGHVAGVPFFWRHARTPEHSSWCPAGAGSAWGTVFLLWGEDWPDKRGPAEGMANALDLKGRQEEEER